MKDDWFSFVYTKFVGFKSEITVVWGFVLEKNPLIDNDNVIGLFFTVFHYCYSTARAPFLTFRILRRPLLLASFADLLLVAIGKNLCFVDEEARHCCNWNC